MAESKANRISPEKNIARKSPVKIWVTKHRPLRDPNLQKAEIFLGAAKSRRESRNMAKGLDLRKGLNIFRILH